MNNIFSYLFLKGYGHTNGPEVIDGHLSMNISDDAFYNGGSSVKMRTKPRSKSVC